MMRKGEIFLVSPTFLTFSIFSLSPIDSYGEKKSILTKLNSFFKKREEGVGKMERINKSFQDRNEGSGEEV